ncbi:TPA: AAA family ATPase [Vibrio parahaemolyticus]|uniref:AAA family ATPase n=1 Tax=Vibrio parahaemolyticus TaxID=670 RepID=UPI00112201DB|nr:AAA family ATPase [Vibrio parahaemolyticus]EJL6785753.1 AAA family ATPase [Vibrio alginolyticus]ELA6986574.1 AAA family ATPase [Vibrio parahaemolyticus]TNY77571.1 AAA family ATPase [Vibrio parahaemolyticus]HCE2280843.1 AAA family ATPase [Vibrio parahaemolyticus]HCG5548169.1 AAA family ATPase [Vibrio parahaemolyticus]
MLEKICSLVEEQYFSSGDFNGYPVYKLISELDVNADDMKTIIRDGIVNEILTVEIYANTHIKAFSNVPKEKMLECFDSEEFPANMCLYIHPNKLSESEHLTKFAESPYQLELAKGKGQLDYMTFDLSVLEFYRNDPRYTYETDFIHGSICITDEYFESSSVPEKDQIILKTFGFAYDDELNRYVAVFVRYLANLSPEHQQIWKAKEMNGSIKLHPDYYASSILGSWGTKMSIFEAFVQELELINKMSQLMGKPHLFHNSFVYDRPKEFGFLLRPTVSEFNSFMLLLDKMMSDNINKKFFENDVEVESEEERSDGKVVIRPKGTIQILAAWIDKFYQTPDPEHVDNMLAAFRKVRKLRQKPAHKVNIDSFDQKLFKEQRKIIIKAYDAVRTLRLMLSNHPAVRVNPPEINDRLYKGDIWDI